MSNVKRAVLPEKLDSSVANNEAQRTNVGVRIPSPEPSLEADPAFCGRIAEELGFESIWYPDHPILPVSTTANYRHLGAKGSAHRWDRDSSVPTDGSIPDVYAHFPDPLISLATASAATTRLMLGTGIILVPERNPLLLAKEVATLDRLSGGRLLLGVGTGWIREETEIMGGDPDHRWGQTREAILAMKELWTNEPAEFHGRFYDFPLVRSNPKPLSDPYSPVLIGGETQRAFERIVEWGDGWLPWSLTPQGVAEGRRKLETLASDAGRDPAAITTTVYGILPRRELVRSFFDAGADRVVVRRETTVNGESEMAADLERIAEEVLR